MTTSQEIARWIALEIAHQAVVERNNKGMFLYVYEFAEPLIDTTLTTAKATARDDALEEAAKVPDPTPDITRSDGTAYKEGYIEGFWDAVARMRSSVRALKGK